MTRSRAATAALTLGLALGPVGAGWATPASAAPPSTTTLVLSTAQSAYGQSVTASAHVDAAGGPADGDVLFTIDGASTKANLSGGGSASIILPRALVGAHAVSATFVPRFPSSQGASTSPTVTWVVDRVRTRLQVRVTGRGAHIPTSVVIGAAGEYGTRPAGTVSVTVRHLGTRKVTRRARTLDATGAATARLGTLPTGSYRLRVTYAGDGQHLGEGHSEKFTVRQR